MLLSLQKAVVGSPPRVRGTERMAMHTQRYQGITPACAGNRKTDPFMALVARDHPRVCGEQPFVAVPAAAKYGSPPRVRGTGEFRTFRGGEERITPACAGNSALPENTKCAA